MAVLTLGGKDFAVAPYKIRELRQAAPYIEAVMARQREAKPLPSAEQLRADPTLMPPDMLSSMTDSVHDILLVIAVGVRRAALDKLDEANPVSFNRAAPLSSQLEEVVDALEGAMVPGDMAGLDATFKGVMVEAGLRKAEENPPMPAQEGGTSAGS